jgi:Asp-tRNA(Asn)/Glu-tRNA(Gln) amidotransferase A subunit family amidase
MDAVAIGLHYLELTELAALIKTREISPVAVTRAQLDRIASLILTPVHPFAPPTLAMIRSLGEQPELISKLQRYTCPFNMTGNPTITLPGGFTDEGLPVAFQLVAANLEETTLVRAGTAFQGVTSWHRRHRLHDLNERSCPKSASAATH